MDNATQLYLTEVRRKSEQRQLLLTWSDGHSAEFDYDYLRGYCPCAACQGHGPGEVVYQPPAGPVTAGTIEPVGNYAICLHFDDEHNTGIYSWDHLYNLGVNQKTLWKEYLDELEKAGHKRKKPS